MKKNEKKQEFVMDRKEYIDLLANKTNEISMSNNNSKTGKACLNLAMHARDVSRFQLFRALITET